MLPVAFLAKERYNGEKEEEASFKELFSALLQNKNLFIIIIVRFLFLLTYTMQVLNPIFAEYVMGNETVGSLLALLISIPTIVLAVVLPMLCRRFDKVHMLLVSMVLYVYYVYFLLHISIKHNRRRVAFFLSEIVPEQKLRHDF